MGVRASDHTRKQQKSSLGKEWGDEQFSKLWTDFLDITSPQFRPPTKWVSKYGIFVKSLPLSWKSYPVADHLPVSEKITSRWHQTTARLGWILLVQIWASFINLTTYTAVPHFYWVEFLVSIYHSVHFWLQQLCEQITLPNNLLLLKTLSETSTWEQLSSL